MRFGEALGLGALVIAVLLLGAEVSARASGGSFLSSVILGQDNRTSTSKTFIFMWTMLVGWALVSLLIAGQVLHTHQCASGSDLDAAKQACAANRDKLGLLQIGWRSFVSTGLTGSYLLLLGIPAAAGVAAKAITQSQVASGAVTKTTAVAPADKTIVARVSQVFSADDGGTDIGDFQYVIFNLIAATYFVSHIIRDPGTGLPPIPDTLLGLTSVSAGLYVAKKAVDRSTPAITAVFPSALRAGDTFTVTGTYLTADPGAPGAVADPAISVNDVQAASVRPDPNIPDRLTAIVPAGLVPAGQTPPIKGTVEVSTAYGAITPGFPVECV